MDAGSAAPVIIGTAGHIDHGKTALVGALTGVDTDRLREEKERGISIDLGFAPLVLPGKPGGPGGRRAGVVDVPGHERLIKNMLAGAGGIDLALLVIAANEGVMPQTREHLAILALLGVKVGVIALTKVDLVDEEWLALVEEEIAGELRGTFLETAPLCRVSAVTGEGLDGLKEALAAAAGRLPGKDRRGFFRLPVDRVFSQKGSGTVATGTVWSGELEAGQEIEILPEGRRVRVRQIQVHGERSGRALAGQRAALNLPGVEVGDLGRGSVLAAPGRLAPTRRCDVRLELLAGGFGHQILKPLRNWARVRVYLGTGETLSRVRLLEGPQIPPGGTGLARLALEEPLVAGKGDRFVIRSYSPLVTLGGGTVLDPHPDASGAVRRRKAAVVAELKVKEKGSPEDLVLHLLKEAGSAAVVPSSAATRTGLEAGELEGVLQALEREGRIVLVEAGGKRLAWYEDGFQALDGALREHLEKYHRAQPWRLGAPLEELRARFCPEADGRLWGKVLERLEGQEKREEKLGAPARVEPGGPELGGQVTPDGHELSGRPERLGEPIRDGGRIVVEGGGVRAARLASHSVNIPGARSGLLDEVAAMYEAALYTPPEAGEAARSLGVPPEMVERALEGLADLGRLIRTPDGLFFSREAAARGVELLRKHLDGHGRITVADYRDLLGASRKYTLALLGYFDTVEITRRIGEHRVAGPGMGRVWGEA
ncbi:MAG: selenocysteine-specific translation elongation factor [Firmicutes bacterium]|nr:selenocysteine-specific translation elongation factor [Bacillota bacterium]